MTTTPRTIAQTGLMNPPAGVIPTQPTMIAVAAPIAVTLRPRIASSMNQTARHTAGVSRVLVKASTLWLPVPIPLPPLKPNQPNHSIPAPSRTRTALCGSSAWRP